MPQLYERHHRYRPQPRRHRSRRRLILWIVAAVLLVGVGFLFVRTTSTIRAVSLEKTIDWEEALGRLPDPAFIPEDNEQHTTILLLGFRGEDDAEEGGGYLTDSVMVLTIDNETGESALLSIPRDLYVPMPGKEERHKLNEAYQIGLFRHGNGLAYTKSVAAFITGLHIDYGILVNMNAFHELVEITDGVTLTLEEPFTEYEQWYCNEEGEECLAWGIEAGTHRIKGQTLDFYIRSRYSSSDFDRARRQQQVLLALKDELLSVGILANPLSINQLLDALGRNIKTDVTVSDVNNLWKLFEKAQDQTPIRAIYTSAPDDLLKDANINGQFVLVPKDGSFAPLRAKANALLSPHTSGE